MRRGAGRGPRHILFAVIVMLLSASPGTAGEMRLPSMPSLPAFEAEYEVGGQGPGTFLEMVDTGGLEAASRPALTQGVANPEAEEVRAHSVRMGYGERTRRIVAVVGEKEKAPEDASHEAEPPVIGQPADEAAGALRTLGFSARPPALGRMGFDR